MVTIHIIVEGGVYDQQVACNVEALRESFYGFFSRLLNSNNVSIVVEIGASDRNAARSFLRNGKQRFLWVDSDSLNTDDWYEKMNSGDRPIVIPSTERDKIYFMIQEMEAWFLKQPQCLYRWAQKERFQISENKGLISNHSIIKNKDIESLSKPSKKVKILVSTFFHTTSRSGRKKGVKYGKLTSAPRIIDELDVDSLKENDAQLTRFSCAVAIMTDE